MRARNLKPGLFKNEILGSSDPLYTLLFEGLWGMADREGRLEDRPLRICAEVFPYRRGITEKRADQMLWWLDEQGFIARYRTDSGLFIQVLEFIKHQNPHKSERTSTIQEFSHDLHRAHTGELRKSNGRKQDVAGLTPSSLTPDSGLLTPDSPFTDSPVPVQSPARGGQLEAEAREGDKGKGLNGYRHPDRRIEFQRVKAVYPEGIYRQSDWLTAEREILKRVEEGVGWDELRAGAERYARQLEACGKHRTQFVKTPTKFFADRDYTEPFPLPEAKSSGGRKSFADHDRESAERLANLPGDDPGAM